MLFVLVGFNQIGRAKSTQPVLPKDTFWTCRTDSNANLKKLDCDDPPAVASNLSEFKLPPDANVPVGTDFPNAFKLDEEVLNHILPSVKTDADGEGKDHSSDVFVPDPGPGSPVKFNAKVFVPDPEFIYVPVAKSFTSVQLEPFQDSVFANRAEPPGFSPPKERIAVVIPTDAR